MCFGYKEFKILWIFLGVSPISQNWASFRVISIMQFRFFYGQGTELEYFLGCLIFLIIFWVNG